MEHNLLITDEEEVDLKYEGPLPNSDLLSYKNMMTEMARSATTDGSCASLLAMAIFTIAAIIAASIIINMFM